jgi:uncharacterized lipoprotein YbaY
MKTRILLGALLSGALLAGGCGHVDPAAASGSDRVLTGEVTYDGAAQLPDDAVVTVRILDNSNPVAPMSMLGETTITRPGPGPVPFRIAYRAEDEVLLHQLNVEARIAFGGKVRFYSVAGHPLTLGNCQDSHVVHVEPVRGGR